MKILSVEEVEAIYDQGKVAMVAAYLKLLQDQFVWPLNQRGHDHELDQWQC